ncbi:MAG TPA: iron uptake system protein EfeO [Mycobacteriales bacterium]|jgi:iron uptake system component EfeO|nr:iron uptake system protein EfeO [Mycobacteriales bacterium]
MRSRPALLVLTAAVLPVLAACSSPEAGAGKAGPITVTATDTRCTLTKTSLDAGTHSFAIRNDGGQVTEFYVYAEGDKIMGEVENIGPGLTRTLPVELPAGRYQAACKPGMTGKGIRTALTVTGEVAKPVSDTAELAAATASYQRYVEAQSTALIEKTGEFVAAVKARDNAKAKALFPVARTYWERIEPVATSFGDLDPKIDARENDVEPGQPWTGFHRLEKDLWVAGDVSGDGAIADQLLADVRQVVTKSKAVTFTPLQMANGSKALLDEVATGKVTGEEDRYSHTDLWDFRGNVDGSQAAIAALRPVLVKRDPALVATIESRFAAVDRLLDTHATRTGYKLYTQLSRDEVRALAVAVDAVAEPLSTVAATVAKR